jgi:hypothetical protein
MLGNVINPKLCIVVRDLLLNRANIAELWSNGSLAVVSYDL